MKKEGGVGMKKKVIAVLMSGMMLVSLLAGCGTSNEQAAEGQSGSKTADAQTEQDSGSGDGGQEEVTLTLWWPGSGDAYEELVNGLADLVDRKSVV